MQIGNEINVGMLWNDGKVVNNDFTNLSLLLKAGYNATKACNSSTQVIIHTADADSDTNARWFYDGIKAKGVNWDITGLSYYCMWHGTLANLYNVITDVRTRYGKPVVIAETAFPFTASNADSTANSVTSAPVKELRHPRPGRRPSSRMCRTPPATPGRSASSTGSDLVRGKPGQRLGSGEHRHQRQRLGQHGGLQLDRPGQPGDQVDA